MNLPHDHADRIARARLALEGLSVGDAFGQCFFRPFTGKLLIRRRLPQTPWLWTDDTAMALSIVEVLDARGEIDQDALAIAFARRYMEDPRRGYGAGAHHYLAEIARGAPWRPVTQAVFEGQGSLGNGGAMRVAPVGAYFADDLDRVAEEARRSAEVTHAHPEGQAGAIAVALAAALARRHRREVAPAWPFADEPAAFVVQVMERTPPGATRDGLERALALGPSTSIAGAAGLLGNGSRVSAPDTVPLCVWAVARFGGSFEEALWQTVSAFGDRDTTCAIVGGVVALHVGEGGVPAAWRAAREALPG
ncbi:MAG: ADP-ribosylglycohydrolase family protein [Planctomycetes bacterium]|nr:ADP-ribosylglycohydrolase family protein [Planctomycetota bacterium]